MLYYVGVLKRPVIQGRADCLLSGEPCLLLTKFFFFRYMKVGLWDKIFTTLLNVPDCNNLPDLMELKNEVDSVLNEIDNLGSQLRNFANVLKSR